MNYGQTLMPWEEIKSLSLNANFTQ